MTDFYNKFIYELPIMPEVVSKILTIPANSEISSKEIEDILKVDPYMTSRILKTANSSFYSREREITSIKDAVTLVGIKKIKTICLLIANSEIISDTNSQFYTNFWLESLNTAFISQAIAEKLGKSIISDDIFTAGILHNIGKAILYNYSKETYEDLIRKSNDFMRDIKELELEEFGVNSNQVGASVLKSWNFPDLHIEVVEKLLNTATHSQFESSIEIVSLANLLSNKYFNNAPSINTETLTMTYQSRLNLRKTDIDYFSDLFIEGLKDNSFFNSCRNTVLTKKNPDK